MNQSILPSRGVAALLLAVIGVAGVGTPSESALAATSGSHVAVAKIFQRVLPVLRSTGVPVLLPVSPSLNRYYATISAHGRGHYELTIGYVPNCNGHACEYGDFEAHLLGKADSRPAKGKPVALPHGITGYYVAATCGANCGDSTVTVDVHGYRYTYGVKAGRRVEVVALARSAVSAGAS